MGKKLTVSDIWTMKKDKKPIVMVTAYDYYTALMADKAGIDIILVGDSLGRIVFGFGRGTIPVTMEQMLHHCKAVVNGVQRALVVGDMPFMSYQISSEDAIRNACRLVKEGGVDAVKLEGGAEYEKIVEAITTVGVPVQGHIGWTPQTGAAGAYGTTVESAKKLIDAAVALERAKAFSIVLDCVASEVSTIIRGKISIPTVGIGGGPDCDGQVLALDGLMHLFERDPPKFAKPYADLAKTLLHGFETYKEEVEKRTFPTEAHTYHMDEKEFAKLRGLTK